MAIKRGTPNRPRVNAKNFSTNQAQKRLDETVAAFNKQVENSLKIDSVEIELFQIQQQVGVPCSCAQTNIKPLASTGDYTAMAPVIPHKESRNDSINFKFQDEDIFGSDLGEKIFNDAEVYDVSGNEAIEADNEDAFADSIMRGSINCGICYRTMMQPGFTVHGRQRSIYTNLNIEDMRGFTVDSTQAPHRFTKVADGFVAFLVTVPRYFTSVTFSIRNNVHMLHDRPYFENHLLTLDDLRRNAGRQIAIHIKAEEFTHFVIDFELGVPKLTANLSGENIALDYDRLTTLSDMTVVIGPSLSDITPGDIIAIPKRNLMLKVRDKERKITATQRRLEWVVQTRVLQPSEPLKAINRGFKLL